MFTDQKSLAQSFDQSICIFEPLKGRRLPAFLVIDKVAKIRFSHCADLPNEILANEDVLALSDKLEKGQGAWSFRARVSETAK